MIFTISLNIGSLDTGACKGNTLYDAWRFLYTIGSNLESCVPYDQSIGHTFNFSSLSSFTEIDRIPLCTSVAGPIGDMCTDYIEDVFSGEEYGTPARYYRCLHFYSIAGVPEDKGTEY